MKKNNSHSHILMNNIHSQRIILEKPQTHRINIVEKILIDDRKLIENENKSGIYNSYSFKSTIFSSSDSKKKQAYPFDFSQLYKKIENREKSDLNCQDRQVKTFRETFSKSLKRNINENGKISNIPSSLKTNYQKGCISSINKVKMKFVKQNIRVLPSSLHEYPLINYKLSNLAESNKKTRREILEELANSERERKKSLVKRIFNKNK